MIPYAIFMISLKLNNGDSIKVRALDQVGKGFSFRAPLHYTGELWDSINSAECSFLDYENKGYEVITVSDFRIVKDDDLYIFTSNDPIFIEKFNKVIGDYIHYIRLKQSLSEEELMSELTGYDLSINYPSSLDEFKRIHTSDVKAWESPLKPVEVALSIDNDYLIGQFLEMPYSAFLGLYWGYNHLDKHPISKETTTHIYIGNQFCPLLTPSIEDLKFILDKCFENTLTPVVVFSTMPEHLIDDIAEKLIFLNSYACEKKIMLELVINDLGISVLARSLNLDSFKFTLGILLNKQKKDPRIKYRSANEKEFDSNYQSSIDAPFYQEYLKNSFNITKFSKEACGYEFDISGDTVLHLPLYQTNTSGHCIMHALCTSLQRGNQVEVHNCPHFCNNEFIAYPDNTSLVGLYNSIFAVSMDELNDVSYLNKQISKGVLRLVISL